jgi:hypothetical protein
MSLRREPYKAQTEAISVRAHTLMQRINKMFTGSRQSIEAITASATSRVRGLLCCGSRGNEWHLR